MASSGDKNVEELKRLVVHTLETNGMLGQIRAELRANVYKVIDEDETRTVPPTRNAAKLQNSPMGGLMAEIVAEFFEFYEFRHSLSVFMPESNLGRNERRSRDQVALDAGLDPRAPRLGEASLLEQLIGLSTGSSEARKGGDCRGDDWHSSASSTTASSPPPAAPSAATRLPPTATESSVTTVLKADPEASPRGKLADSHAGAAVASTSSAISSAMGASGHGSGHAASTTAAAVAASEEPEGPEATVEAVPVHTAVPQVQTEEGAPEEAPGKSSKPRRKQLLPSLSGPKDFLSSANPGGPGQLPPLKASLSPASLSGGSDRGGAEEVSLSESSVGVSRESCEEVRDEVLRLDRRLARFPHRAATGTGLGGAVSTATPAVAATAGRDGGSSNGSSPVIGSPIGAAPVASGVRDFNSSLLSESGEKVAEASANDVSAVSAASQVSAPGPARSLPRSPATSSPANSSAVGESPLRSPPLSPLGSSGQQASSASPMGVTADSLASPGASPQSSGSAAHSAAAQSVPEDAAANQNESMSIEESSGDGDLDLALGGAERSTTNAPGASQEPDLTVGGALKRTPAPFPSSGAMQTIGPEDEVDEDIDEEDISNNSHESYQSSEAALSTGALSRGDDTGF